MAIIRASRALKTLKKIFPNLERAARRKRSKKHRMRIVADIIDLIWWHWAQQIPEIKLEKSKEHYKDSDTHHKAGQIQCPEYTAIPEGIKPHVIGPNPATPLKIIRASTRTINSLSLIFLVIKTSMIEI